MPEIDLDQLEAQIAAIRENQRIEQGRAIMTVAEQEVVRSNRSKLLTLVATGSSFLSVVGAAIYEFLLPQNADALVTSLVLLLNSPSFYLGIKKLEHARARRGLKSALKNRALVSDSQRALPTSEREE